MYWHNKYKCRLTDETPASEGGCDSNFSGEHRKSDSKNSKQWAINNDEDTCTLYVHYYTTRLALFSGLCQQIGPMSPALSSLGPCSHVSLPMCANGKLVSNGHLCWYEYSCVINNKQIVFLKVGLTNEELVKPKLFSSIATYIVRAVHAISWYSHTVRGDLIECTQVRFSAIFESILHVDTWKKHCRL